MNEQPKVKFGKATIYISVMPELTRWQLLKLRWWFYYKWLTDKELRQWKRVK